MECAGFSCLIAQALSSSHPSFLSQLFNLSASTRAGTNEDFDSPSGSPAASFIPWVLHIRGWILFSGCLSLFFCILRFPRDGPRTSEDMRLSFHLLWRHTLGMNIDTLPSPPPSRDFTNCYHPNFASLRPVLFSFFPSFAFSLLFFLTVQLCTWPPNLDNLRHENSGRHGERLGFGDFCEPAWRGGEVACI